MLTVRMERLALKPGDWVLDLGCGEGRHVHGIHVLDGVNIAGLDLDLPSLAKGREGLEMLPASGAVTAFMIGDAYRLPFADATFDAVICSEVLEHLHDYPLALAEIRRVLKPGGMFAPTVPRAWPERICWNLASGPGGYSDQPGGHIRIFQEDALAGEVSALGFGFLGKHYAHGLHSPYWWLKCALWDRRDDHPLVRLYNRFLVWDLMKRPWLTRGLEALLDPVMGKSVALYFRKQGAGLSLAVRTGGTIPIDLRGAVEAMLSAQRPDGAIPWFDDGPWDAWNHAECLMALAVMGEMSAVEAGFDHLQATQAPDGSWLGEYGNALPMDGRVKIARVAAPVVKDSNFIAYPAVAVWHHFVLTGEREAARRRWPMVRAAIDLLLSLQHPQGDISWCAEAHGQPGDDAVLAGNASIYASLGCALKLAALVGEAKPPAWQEARARLRTAILAAPHRFDRAGQDRSGFAMDAYYPILAGVTPTAAAYARLETKVAPFIHPGLGCRCGRLGQPWVTVAEFCELAMALIRLGAGARAATLLSWQQQHRDADGAYWMGWQAEEAIVWPQEKPSWTQAAVILAADALHGATPACAVLTSG